jgi:5'-nucleotidase
MPPMSEITHVPAKRPRAWQRMLSGRRLDLLDPSPEDIAIEDIAHGLARVARWNGQTKGAHAFSVAQHALIVTDIAEALNPAWPTAWRRAALLHDAAEYVIGDLISPFKAAVGLDYQALEHRLLVAIHRRFVVPVPLPGDVASAIKAADRAAAYFEATQLAGFDSQEADDIFGRPDLPCGLTEALSGLTALPPELAHKAFIERFQSIAT